VVQYLPAIQLWPPTSPAVHSGEGTGVAQLEMLPESAVRVLDVINTAHGQSSMESVAINSASESGSTAQEVGEQVPTESDKSDDKSTKKGGGRKHTKNRYWTRREEELLYRDVINASL